MSIKKFLEDTIKEDIGRGDLFARVVTPSDAKAKIIAKSDGVLAGVEYINELINMYDISFKWYFNDGDRFKIGDKLVDIEGKNTTILSLERTILNIIHHTSSIATLTAKFVDIIRDRDVKLLDTRKTRPLLRELEKYAVRCGGGINHRFGLDDSLMLKDTHLKTIKDLDVFMKNARKQIPFTSKIEIECEDIDMVREACRVGADIIMCDNMSIDEIKEVVEFRNKNYPHILLEASGNVTLESISEIATTGVDAISTGSTIHQSNWIDLSMKVVD
ncbi:Quinolinate phosphoribosyltransferase [decarboxylating] [hydrothermal vent metagenome]|uniref:Probable nicotinate-nucleotide pyrophosphorylase [carboxylating] n=1 Tax=hydrothermal vent metagenome TaxID=652676 RepID=A0A1W1EJZ7_9ZZZZ